MFRSRVLRGLAATAIAAGCAAVTSQAIAAELPHGVFAFYDMGTTPPAAIYHDADVVGVTLQTPWSMLEPSPGQFAWAELDAKVAAAAAAGRMVALGVMPGAFSPSWVYALGAARFSYTWTLDWGYTKCSTVSYPLPWDPTYSSAWQTFVAAFGKHYAANPAVVMVKVDGVNGPTPELLLPYSVLGHTPPNGLQCGNTPVAPVSAWKAAGYRPSKVTTAWTAFVAAFASSFPTQQLVVETGPWGFPPIDANGNIIAGSTGDYVLPKTLLSVGLQAIGARYAVQSDGLQSNWNWVPPTSLPADVPLGYLTGAPVTGDPTCRANGYVTPCSPPTVMREIVARANAAKAEFLELFPPDLLNSALTEIIAGFDG